jgi:hypothetical protein
MGTLSPWQVIIVCLAVVIIYDCVKWLLNRRHFCPVCGKRLKVLSYLEGYAECCTNCYFMRNYRPSVFSRVKKKAIKPGS